MHYYMVMWCAYSWGCCVSSMRGVVWCWQSFGKDCGRSGCGSVGLALKLCYFGGAKLCLKFCFKCAVIS